MVEYMVNQGSSSRDAHLPNPLLAKSRLGECEVCGEVSAKYSCPACEVKTCSLPCVHVHKKELDCTGIRNRVKYKPIHQFTDMDLQSDYTLLEEMGRSVERVVKARRPFQKNLAFKWQKLKNHLLSHGTHLHFLPPRFSKHMSNTSFLNWNTGVVYWKVEWLFPQSTTGSSESVVDARVDETTLVSDLLEKYLSKDSTVEPELRDRLKPYLDAGGHNAVKVLMKVEKVPGTGKYMLMNPSFSLAENLQGKIIIEHPTFYVVLTTAVQQYEIVSPESVEVRRGPTDRKRRRQSKGDTRRTHTNGSIKFFSDNLSESDSD